MIEHALDDSEVHLADDGWIPLRRIQQRAATQRDAEFWTVITRVESQPGQANQNRLAYVSTRRRCPGDEFVAPFGSGLSGVTLGVRAGAGKVPGQRGGQSGVFAGGRVCRGRPIHRSWASPSAGSTGGSVEQPQSDECVEMFANGVRVRPKVRGGIGDPNRRVRANVIEHPQPLPGQRYFSGPGRTRSRTQFHGHIFHGINCSKLRACQ